LVSDVPCNKDSTDVNGLGLVAAGSIRLDETDLGLGRAEEEKRFHIGEKKSHLRVLTGSRGIDFDAIDNSCSTGFVFCKNKIDM